MASGKPCVTEMNMCQLCGHDMQSCNARGHSIDYQKQIDPPVFPYSQILPDSRYEEDARNERRRKGKLETKNKTAPVQICIPLSVVSGKVTTKTDKDLDKNPSSKAEDNKEKEKEKEDSASGNSAAMKVNRLLLFLLASCFPCQGGGQPVKMMLCLPCPPPTEVAGSSSRGPGQCVKNKPRDYTYRCESRELRGGNLYSCCQCIKRNGLQHDCPRTPCQGRPACLTKPWPDCWPSGGCHGIDFTREKGTKRYDPCREQRFDKKECRPPGSGARADCGGNMMVVVCPPPTK